MLENVSDYELLSRDCIAMNERPQAKGFLVDGFPRNQDNFEGWMREMGNKAKVHFVLYLSCPEDVCTYRCLHRGQGRTDDNEESLRKRIQTYHNQTLPIINHYKELDLVREVSSVDPPDQVYIFKNFLSDLKFLSFPPHIFS
ncbi:unnamed protein product [Anisakis simplex]|uniref:Uncharacterized protein n=1 Tax=Anisakis simplex TaxID=6269 RepID=A0A3P6SP99_ANISI|nr:unnamed protein product [Anisakis simplex]